MENKNEASESILPTLLFITFLVLKLCKVIDWSWWWVCSPLWIPLALIIGIAVIAGIIAIVFYLLERKDKPLMDKYYDKTIEKVDLSELISKN